MSRKKHSKELKANITLDAIKGQKTISELTSGALGRGSCQTGRLAG
jgi:transposase-like protein